MSELNPTLKVQYHGTTYYVTVQPSTTTLTSSSSAPQQLPPSPPSSPPLLVVRHIPHGPINTRADLPQSRALAPDFLPDVLHSHLHGAVLKHRERLLRLAWRLLLHPVHEHGAHRGGPHAHPLRERPERHALHLHVNHAPAAAVLQERRPLRGGEVCKRPVAPRLRHVERLGAHRVAAHAPLAEQRPPLGRELLAERLVHLGREHALLAEHGHAQPALEQPVHGLSRHHHRPRRDPHPAARPNPDQRVRARHRRPDRNV
ncbi:unnamed protein product [Chondrus crispus]|uniref:Uncharacterized protein n=1 Tax=Chondrus crispus TaxID=2769 RepID=R7QHC4_CHOCR|nr:unnamed protein product [Chondrus crispus]CDF36866.1 unnamed protein product [Chondrus crispus]|eukprot:XP_005716685.1 unnamed protein product [Chondrus crispus]